LPGKAGHERLSTFMTGDVTAAPARPPRFVQPPMVVERRADGSTCLKCEMAVTPRYAHVPDLLAQRARQVPNRAIIAQRGKDDRWETISYAALEERSSRVASFLLEASGGPHTPLLILSGNSIEHAVMMLGAMKARVPVTSVSVAYSLMDKDFSKLKLVAASTQANWVFADNAAMFAPACRAIAKEGMRFIACSHIPDGHEFIAYESLTAHPVTAELQVSLDAIDDSTPAKYMFTSGSTGVPKAVVHTQGMLRAQIAAVDAIRQTHDDFEHAPLSLNWMPWSHVSAGNMSFHENLLEAGTLYLDNGRPIPGQFEETLRNLREVSPSFYGCAPIGYTWLADALAKDTELRASFFKNLTSMIYGGAALPLPTYERVQALAVSQTGQRIPFMSVYGSTEAGSVTLTYTENLASGMIGLPAPGVDIKLVPRGEKLALYVRGAGVFKEYLRQPALTAASFDQEGYFDTGDAVRFLDEQAPGKGLIFDGRTSEDFKLTSGTWVASGIVRLNLLSALDKLLDDVVICGENRPYLTAMGWLNTVAARELLPQSALGESTERAPPDSSLADNAHVRAGLLQCIARYNASNPGSSTRIRRITLLQVRPSVEYLEINEKGSVNQRAVIARRSKEIDRLYQEPIQPEVLELDSAQPG
jgi:feruloyl-CoA synthase